MDIRSAFKKFGDTKFGNFLGMNPNLSSCFHVGFFSPMSSLGNRFFLLKNKGFADLTSSKRCMVFHIGDGGTMALFDIARITMAATWDYHHQCARTLPPVTTKRVQLGVSKRTRHWSENG